MASRVITVLVEKVVRVTVDDTAFTPEVIAAVSRAAKREIATVEDCAEHLALAHVTSGVERPWEIVPGFGRLHDLGVSIIGEPLQTEIMDS